VELVDTRDDCINKDAQECFQTASVRHVRICNQEAKATIADCFNKTLKKYRCKYLTEK